jgi:AcrR family transcriptional regulator
MQFPRIGIRSLAVKKDRTEKAAGTGLGRAALALDRGMAQRREAAEAEIERILAVTLELLSREPAAVPSVSEIVRAAGISNHTLYRFFPSKNELIMAVFEKGVQRAAEWIGAGMVREPEPRQQVRVWVRGLLHQVSGRAVARASRTVVHHLGAAGLSAGAGAEDALLRPVTSLLDEPLRRMGRDPRRDGPYVADVTLGAMRRYLWTDTVPAREDVDRLADFALRGLDTGGR